MKIGELDRKCNQCEILGHCGFVSSSSLCLCKDERFKEMETDEYKRLCYQTDASTVNDERYDDFLSKVNICESEDEYEGLKIEFYNQEFAHQIHEMIKQKNK